MIEIPQNERGVIRVFSVSRPMGQMARALQQQSKLALAAELLAHPVPEGSVELFAVSDLTGVGLPHYLTDGYSVDPVEIHADRQRLDALDGYILLLHSTIAGDDAVTLSPTADLTLIGTYADPTTSRAVAPIIAESAELYSGVTDAPKPPSRSRGGSALVALAVLVGLALIWWIL